ncbi:hypothetical protein D3C75_855740 [compost metagenome]
MGGDREHHAEVERLALGLVLVDHRLQGVGLDRVHRLAVCHRHVFLHLRPHRVGHGDGVAVEVHGEGGDHVGLGAEADGGAQRLAGQHVRAIQLAGDHAVEQHLPVGLGLEADVQPLVLEEALLVGDGQRCHVGEFDEAELELFLLRIGGQGDGAGQRGEQQGGGAGQAGQGMLEAATANFHGEFSGSETKKDVASAPILRGSAGF